MSLYVLRVCQVFSKSAGVWLSDDRVARVPLDLAEWGTAVSADDFEFVGGRWVHRRFVKPKRKEPILYRDLSEYDAAADQEMMRRCMMRCYKTFLGKFWSSDHSDDLLGGIYVTLGSERSLYQRWDDSKKSDYEGYMQRAVENWFRDYKRMIKAHPDWYFKGRRGVRMVQLNAPVGRVDGSVAERIDFIEDKLNSNFVELVERDALLSDFQAVALEMDGEIVDAKKGFRGTGLPGFSYSGILDAMVGGTLESYLKSFRYNRKLLDNYVDHFRSSVAWIAKSYGMEVAV